MDAVNDVIMSRRAVCVAVNEGGVTVLADKVVHCARIQIHRVLRLSFFLALGLLALLA